MLSMTASPRPAGLYLHVPFCRRKCAYCDFYSLADPGSAVQGAYLSAVEQELRTATLPGRIETVFLGGGTPTVLPAPLLSRLLVAIADKVDVSAVSEFSVEANPGAVDEPRAALLRAHGVNRLSLGVQSFQPATLATLGRIHGPDEVHQAVRLFRRLGFSNLSLDLIFAVPGQTLADWQADLDAALGLAPEHLSVYGLSIEPSTPLGRLVGHGQLHAAPDELYVEMFTAARERLIAASYEHYEISNYARPGFRCRHNVGYWRNRPYLGLGPAASSFVAGRRWTNVRDLDEYLACLARGQSPAEEIEELSPEARARELAMLNLRMADGIILQEFHDQTGFDALQLFDQAIRTHRAAGLLEVTSAAIRLTPQALPIADTVLVDFVS
jgi:oxygen-independent coproporphyrinogen-3 oxidase